MSEKSIGYKVLGLVIFAGTPALFVGLLFSLLHPVVGVVMGLLVLAFWLSILWPRHDRGEKW